MNTSSLTQENKTNIKFIGDALAPLYQEDPTNPAVLNLWNTFGELDCQSAARDWPFVPFEEAYTALTNIQEGLFDKEDALIEEYRRLFVGPRPKTAPLWGSVYTDRDGVIFGMSALELEDWLCTNGIKRIAQDNMPPDHLGDMLALMSWIAEYKPNLLGDYLENHFLSWAFHFLEIMQSQTTHLSFKGLAEITYASLKGIEQTLDLDINEPIFYR